MYLTTIVIRVYHKKEKDTEGLDNVIHNVVRKWDYPHVPVVTMTTPKQLFSVRVPMEDAQ